ncbi:MAG: 3-phosphoshikimate 1-carboxyvinyltransferase [Bordetella sp.]|nr:MAG: 3-phosphoshikimate 1-carboxyvinyltransferase [Bordetella sp.]
MNSTQKISYLDLPSISCAHGVVHLPGSKSISNRVLLLSALSEGRTEIINLLDSEDTLFMKIALKKLGVLIKNEGINSTYITGGKFFPVNNKKLYLGNSGTAFRSLTAVLSLIGGNYELLGTARMCERPISDLVNALRMLGATITYLGQDGYPPLLIEDCSFNSEFVQIQSSISSQFLTGLLLAGPIYTQRTQKPLTIEITKNLISKPYINITLDLMKRFGVNVYRDNFNRFIIPENSIYLSPSRIKVEGDASSASYFLALGAIGNGPVRVTGIGSDSIQGDIEFSQTLKSMGADIKFGENWIESTGLKVSIGEKIKAFNSDFNRIPDAAMTAAVLALYADGPCYLRNIGSWRVKETDRIFAMQNELEKLGIQTKSGPDWLSIKPIDTNQWHNASIKTWNDHRMAMSFSLSAFGKSNIRIMNPSCVEKHFPIISIFLSR